MKMITASILTFFLAVAKKCCLYRSLTVLLLLGCLVLLSACAPRQLTPTQKREFDQAIQLDPNNSLNYFRRGHAYYQIEQQHLAIEDFSRAIELDPNYGSPYYNRGNARGKLGKRALACEDIRKACELFTEQGQRERAEDACYSFKRNCK